MNTYFPKNIFRNLSLSLILGLIPTNVLADYSFSGPGSFSTDSTDSSFSINKDSMSCSSGGGSAPSMWVGVQGGNSDNADTGQKRRKIGKYLLPPDTRKGHKHHRGVISMPSSEIENPHKLASPYEFFIVHQSPGAYHLDGSYTVFGKVIRGMEVVDAINALPTDKREWPLTNMRMRITVLNE